MIGKRAYVAMKPYTDLWLLILMMVIGIIMISAIFPSKPATSHDIQSGRPTPESRITTISVNRLIDYVLGWLLMKTIRPSMNLAMVEKLILIEPDYCCERARNSETGRPVFETTVFYEKYNIMITYKDDYVIAVRRWYPE